MLTESFLVATLTPEQQTNNSIPGIHVHDLQPLPALRSTFKKSSSNPNCIAVNRTHIFAAQADKAVVHVYSRERNNQEATVPFPERICSLALAGEKDGAGVLVLGTDGGRIILWELGTGRQVSTPQHHLQPVTSLVVDLTSNFLLSGSSDSNINVWSIAGLLSWSASSSNNNGQEPPFSPTISLSAHRTAITAVAFGHSASSSNIAVSISKEGTCVVWNYVSGTALHTYLLPSGSLCIVLDPADRALYVGYENGSIQFVDFYKPAGSSNLLYNLELGITPSQPPETDRWLLPPSGEASAILSLDISYDGTLLVSGHRNGKINVWDIATRTFQKELNDLCAPVTNLTMLLPVGFPDETQPVVKLHNVIKPQYESFASNGGSTEVDTVPLNYTFAVQFISEVSIAGVRTNSSFQEALRHPLFPNSILEEVSEGFSSSRNPGLELSDSADFENLRVQNAALKSQLETALAQQRSAAEVNKARDAADWIRQQDEGLKAGRKKERRLLRIKAAEVLRKKEMGEQLENGDEKMADDEVIEVDEDLSSSTDED